MEWLHYDSWLQGPALRLFNNEVFEENDWRGIRKLSDSIKKDDPLKVGQFGLGFKSVFHLTGKLLQYFRWKMVSARNLYDLQFILKAQYLYRTFSVLETNFFG